MEPNYAPNVKNQTVDFGGQTWKGQPGQGWVLQSSTQEYADQKGREIQQGFKDAVKPAIDSLTASKPEVAAQYDTRSSQVAAAADPLKARYEKLIADIKGAGAQQVTNTTRVTAQEFGRRGIPLSSTSAQEEQLRRTQPIEEATTSGVTDVTLDREEKLRSLDDTITNIMQEKIAAERGINNTIASLQATSGTDAANAAIQMFQFQEQKRQADLDRAIQERLATVAETNANKTTAPSLISVGKDSFLFDPTSKTFTAPPQTIKSVGGNLGNNYYSTAPAWSVIK